MRRLGFRKLIKNKIKLFFSNFFGLFCFLFLAIFIWTPLHEFLHISILKFFNHNYQLYWNYFLLPKVRCLDCGIYNKVQMFFYSFFPYIVDLIVLITGSLFYKYKVLRYLMHFGFFDIITNYFTMLPALIFGLPNDFLNIIRLGFWYIAFLLFIVSIYLWFKKNKNLAKSFIKKYHSMYKISNS